jgi:hypothetical protein
MCHQQKAPLRSLSVEERDQLEQFSRSLTQAADQVIHAKEVLAVADGHSKTLAAKLAGRTSGEAVAPLPARFNAQGLPALETRHRVVLPSATVRSPVSGSCGSFDALMIAGWMGLPPGRW